MNDEQWRSFGAVSFLAERDGLPMPRRAYEGDAGYDLATSADWTVAPLEWADIPTGLRMATPPGYWAWIVGRSSTLRRWGLQCQGGIIDEGYRGPLFVCVLNLQLEPVEIPAGTPLAQVILFPLVRFPSEWVAELPESDRGTNGFGSTG